AFDSHCRSMTESSAASEQSEPSKAISTFMTFSPSAALLSPTMVAPSEDHHAHDPAMHHPCRRLRRTIAECAGQIDLLGSRLTIAVGTAVVILLNEDQSCYLMMRCCPAERILERWTGR